MNSPCGGRDPGLRHAHHVLLHAPPVGDQVGDGDQREVVVVGEHPQLVAAGHVALVLLRDDLAERAGGGEPGEPGEVDGGLGVPRPAQHAALAGPQRQHVPGPHQVAGDGGRVGEQRDRPGPVRGRDAGGDAGLRVDGHGEGGAEAVGVGVVHRRQVEPVAVGLGERHADVAGGVAHHERHQLRRGLLRREDQIALVLAVRVVDHHHRPSGREIGEGPLDRGEVRPGAGARRHAFGTLRRPGIRRHGTGHRQSPRTCSGGRHLVVHRSPPAAARRHGRGPRRHRRARTRP